MGNIESKEIIFFGLHMVWFCSLVHDVEKLWGYASVEEPRKGIFHTLDGVVQLLFPTWLHLMFTTAFEVDTNYYFYFTDKQSLRGLNDFSKATLYVAEPGLEPRCFN